MARYLTADNNLADLSDVIESRLNLGLGNIATMSANEVNITGGNIQIDSFRLRPSHNLQNQNYFLRAGEGGQAEWFEIKSFEWLEEDQINVKISGFSNDTDFIQKHTLCNIAFSSDWNDLINVPQSLTEVYTDDITSTFLVKSNNLSDLQNLEAARNNLGLGTIATQSSEELIVTNLTVNHNITLRNSSNEGYLYVDVNSNIVIKSNFDLATDTIPGIVFTCNDNVDIESTVPTSSVLFNLYSNASSNIENLKLGSLSDIVSLFEGNNFLFKSNFLGEFSSVEDAFQVRNNLGLGSLSTQNSNNVHISKLTIKNLIFDDVSITQNKLFFIDQSGNAVFSNLPHATTTTPGTVQLIQDFFAYVPDQFANISVLTMDAFQIYFTELENNLQHLNNIIPKNISDLVSGEDTFLLKINNLSDITDTVQARINLGLATVAHTGLYTDIVDSPSNISQFNNNLGFISGHCNLSDLTDITSARKNLGLGNMAEQDVENVQISGGYVYLDKLKINDTFRYQDKDNIPFGKILICADNTGRMEWKDLPKATNSTFGAVKITDFLNENDQRVDVVPTCRIFSQIQQHITDRIVKALIKFQSI
jgi:hypothetical protein